MDINTVIVEIAEELEAVTGLVAVYNHIPGNIAVPCAIVDWPESVDYDATYGGSATATFPVALLVSKVSDKQASLKLGGFVEDAKAALDGNLGGAVDSARVERAYFVQMTFAGVEYLGVIFDLNVIT